MPLRDHFHPPLSERFSWDSVHGMWPGMIVLDLNKRLPAQYAAAPNIHLGTSIEVDVAAIEREEGGTFFPAPTEVESGTVATVIWAPPQPTLALDTDAPEMDEYEVRITHLEMGRLVAAIEIVSPANKDRPEHRRAFAAKCIALLQQGVSVSILDFVTSRGGNLYAEVLAMLGHSDPSLGQDPPSLYAVEFRWRQLEKSWRLETWAYPLAVGASLPTLPLWLADDLAVPLNLESTYEEACRGLRIT